MKKVAVFGGSGLVGKQVIESFISSDFDVVSYQRSISNSKYGEIQEQMNFDKINDYKFDGDIVVICLGTTISKAGSEESFIKIDHDLIVEIGKWAKRQNVKQLHVISTVGASESAKGIYLQTKWRMEQSLQKLDLPTLFIYRPSLYADFNRRPIRFKELASIPVLNFLGSLASKFSNYRPIQTEVLVKKIKSNALKNLEGNYIFESSDIQKADSLTFEKFRKREQNIMTIMFSILLFLWTGIEAFGLGNNSIRIFTSVILLSLIFLWIKSKISLSRGEGYEKALVEYNKIIKSLRFMQVLIWIEVLAIILSLVFSSLPFFLLLLTMIILDIQIYYTFKDYLNSYNN